MSVFRHIGIVFHEAGKAKVKDDRQVLDAVSHAELLKIVKPVSAPLSNLGQIT